MPSDLSFVQSAVVHAAVGTPELGWCICEPLIMPLLLDLHVPTELLAICWVVSPLAGMFLHPLFGHLSDVYGRRFFIVLFGLMATAGLTATSLLAHLPDSIAIVGVMGAFGLTDLCHDLLLTPTRALMNDLFDAEDTEWRAATSGSVGKLFGVFLASSLPRDYAFIAGAATIAAICMAQAWAPSVKPTITVVLDDTQSALPPQEVVAAEAEDACEKWFVWTLSFSGYTSIVSWSFYFTSVWAHELLGAEEGSQEFSVNVRWGSLVLTMSAVVNLIVGFFLVRIVALLGGEFSALVAVQFLIGAGMLSFHFAPVVVSTAFSIVGMPVGYQVIFNTPFAWLETKLAREKAGEAHRGRLTGWLNNALAVAQLLVAVLSGPVVSALGGRLTAAFDAVAILNLVVGVVIAVLSFNRLIQRGRVEYHQSDDANYQLMGGLSS
eukprot:TRINITY_DN68152_c0_g1_i1.p1 TRINITY_DN68152_c0_g1~~TRINITY_DN68152_c0_g1_i1.p1  ORF type:complete len:436 (-),score=58.53 TRINITY_DN68152_c0_g1_i1:351-1658(-)